MEYETKNKNYYIKNAMAYTEDNLRVHKLYLGNIPADVEDEEVLAYFRRYGKVLEMQLTTAKYQKNNLRKGLKSCNILFDNAIVATKVLQKTKHILHKKKIIVTACYSWHQPDAYKFTNNKRKPTDNSGAPAALNIVHLNDDCLALIAKHLDLRSQVRMSLSSTRFSGILEICSKLKYKKLSLADFAQMTLWEIREFFLVAGNAIESINGDLPYKYKERIFEIIAENCPNVKHLHIRNTIIQTNSLLKLCANLKNITELRLHNCDLKDNAFMNIHKLTKLEVLGLPENYTISGKHLSQLTKLRELDLQTCIEFQTSNFIEILKSSKNLKKLNIKNCPRLLDKAFDLLEKHAPQLESLSMSCPHLPYKRVAHLPMLKRLEVNANHIFIKRNNRQNSEMDTNWSSMERALPIAHQKALTHLILAQNHNVTNDCLGRFSELEQLEEIDLRSAVTIQNFRLLNLVRACTKLRRITIQGCGNISNEFVFHVIQLLQERQQSLPANQEMEPLVCDVFNTGISEDIMDHPPCLDATSFIKLSFDCILP